MNDSFKSLIDGAKSILVLLPQTPNFDEVASGLGLYLCLKGEKEINIVCASDMTVSFNRLVGVNKITAESGSKNLIVRFVNYPAKNIEKVSYDIIDGEFQLTVVPKTEFQAPKNEQINLKYSGIHADMIVLVGGKEQSDFPLISEKEDAAKKFVHLGLATIRGQKELISFDRPASSISELVASLIKESGLALDPDIATNLLMGIEEGSDGLTAPEVNADTFSAMSDLMRAGGRRIPKREMPDPGNFPAGAIPQKVIQFEAEAESGESDKEVISEADAPQDWFEPKVYKGTSVS